MLSLVILRHGQTAWNLEGRMQGQLDIPLDALGRRQAAHVASELMAEGITSVVSSDLVRASATAARVGQPVRLDSRLREQHYGDWQGLTHEQIATKPARVGGESLAEVGERALAAVVDHLPEQGTLLVVTHGDTARALTGRLLCLAPDEWDQLPALGNTEWLRLAFDHGTWDMSRETGRAGESIPA